LAQARGSLGRRVLSIGLAVMVCGLLLVAVSLRAAVGAGRPGRPEGGDHELAKLVGELQQMAARQQERIEAYEAMIQRAKEDGPKHRQLQAANMPSIYGDDFANGKRAYTAQESFDGALSHAWVLMCGFLVMFMQAGFAMVQAGSCRVGNVQNVLMKSLTVVCMSTFGWWIFGWSFAFSGPTKDGGLKKNGFGGHEQFAGHHFLRVRSDGQQEPTEAMLHWFFQWAVCSIATTIMTSGASERVNFAGYCLVSFLLAAFIYPVVAAWTWGGGWLNDFNDTGYFDFAGSGIVHMTGGVGALLGAIIVGPRKGRFAGTDLKERILETPRLFEPQRVPMILLGTLILWFGWYGLTCGSVRSMNSVEKGFMAAQVAMNTTIAACMGGLVVFLMRLGFCSKLDVPGFCNGILAGLVSISAPCGNVECGSAMCIGLCGGVIFQAFSMLLKVVKVDDPVDAFAVHGACGMWGVFAAALFDWGKGFKTVHGWRGFRCIRDASGANCAGLVDGLGKDLVASNMLEILSILGWVGVLCAISFLPLKLGRFLRYDEKTEEGNSNEAKADYDFEDVCGRSEAI